MEGEKRKVEKIGCYLLILGIAILISMIVSMKLYDFILNY